MLILKAINFCNISYIEIRSFMHVWPRRNTTISATYIDEIYIVPNSRKKKFKERERKIK